MADQVIYNTDLIINIKKKRDSFRIVSGSSPYNVNIAYIVGDEVVSDNLLHITDRSGSLKPNWPIGDRNWVEFYGSGTTVNYYNFLITDVFVGDSTSGSQKKTPLFYRHKLQKVTDTLIGGALPIDDSLTITEKYAMDIKLLDKNMNELDISEVEYHLGDLNASEVDYPCVYCNLRNKFDYTTGEWNIYFVRYAMKIVYDNGQTEYHVYTDLLSPEPIFTEATTDDYDSSGILKSGRKVYELNEAGSTLYIKLPDTQYYAIKPEADRALRLVAPDGLTMSDPWFISLSANRVLDNYNGQTFIYDVTEYKDQQFNPWIPLKYIEDEQVIRVNKSVYKLSKSSPIVPGLSPYVSAEASEMHITAKVYNENDILVDIFTTDPQKITQQDNLTGLIWRKISGVDITDGFIALEGEYPRTYTIEATFYYAENNYEYVGVDFNPVTNSNVVGYMYVFCINPQSSINPEPYMFYMKVDNTGKIIYSYSPSRDLSSAAWNNKTYSEFIDDYSVIGDNMNRILILGEVWIGSDVRPEEVDTIDIRQEGGGIDENYLEDLLF